MLILSLKESWKTELSYWTLNPESLWSFCCFYCTEKSHLSLKPIDTTINQNQSLNSSKWAQNRIRNLIHWPWLKQLTLCFHTKFINELTAKILERLKGSRVANSLFLSSLWNLHFRSSRNKGWSRLPNFKLISWKKRFELAKCVVQVSLKPFVFWKREKYLH